MEAITQKLGQIISRRQRQYISAPNRVPSAVLVPIFFKQGEYHLLLTKRTETVQDHKGQISFPGGAYQEEDKTLVDTALRECAEEIGLLADKVEILGALDDFPTVISNYVISPFVALIPWPYQFTINEEEIAEIVEVPISALLDKHYWREEIRMRDNRVSTVHFCHYQEKLIWGTTAKILKQFLEIFTQAADG